MSAQSVTTDPSARLDAPHGVARNPSRGRDFVCDDGLVDAGTEGGPAYRVRVRLTSYRSLPLSCVERIELAVDGVAVAPETIRFVLAGTSHRLDELAGLSQVWWFILDHADLVVPEPLAPGEHDVAGTLVTVEPYVTNGRFSFTHTSVKRLTLRTLL